MSEINKESLHQIGPNESREQKVTAEKDLRTQRDVALNDFRQGKLFGSFNTQYIQMREAIRGIDDKYDNTYSAYDDYLRRLKQAIKEGTPLKEVKKPTLALIDTKVGQAISRAAKNTGYLMAKAITWTSPVMMISDIAGELWDQKQFEQVRDLTELTEKQRERVIDDLNNEIAQTTKQIQSVENAEQDKKAEAAAKQKDAELADQIREGLGIDDQSDQAA